MIYLITQIALCLLMALLVGGLVGWLWRGYRESDRLEDLRETLRATEEVKDRELSEAYRLADSAEARAESLQRQLDEARRKVESAAQGAVGGDAPEEAAGARQARDVVAELETALERARRRAEAAEHELRDRESRLQEREERLEALAAEAERLRERLQDAPGAGSDDATEGGASRPLEDEAEADAERSDDPRITELRAELESLHVALDSKAEQLANAQARILELEPLEARLRARDRVAQEARAMARRELEAKEEELREVRGRLAELEPLQERLDHRTREVNELRRRLHDAVARAERFEARFRELEERVDNGAGDGEAAADDPDSEGPPAVLAEVERLRDALHRQIERNRRQEAVHRAVVANLREELGGTAEGTPRSSGWQPDRDDRDS